MEPHATDWPHNLRPRDVATPIGMDVDAERHLLRLIRNARGACGRCCPRCRSQRVVRWGSFLAPERTRQRFRCHDCARTFSDLTGSALAYTKRLSRWHLYLLLMHHTATVRDSATAVRIHPSTALRWRHRVLRALHDAGTPPLAGWIELHTLSLAWSQKGKRVSHREPRTRGRRFDHSEGRRLRLLYAAAREGQCNTLVLRTTTGANSLEELLQASFAGRLVGMHAHSDAEMLRAHFAHGSTLIHRERQTSHFARDVRRCGLRYISTCASRAAPDGVITYGAALAYSWAHNRWMHRFRGVASRYFTYYVAWHRCNATATALMWLERCLRSWCPAPP